MGYRLVKSVQNYGFDTVYPFCFIQSLTLHVMISGKNVYRYIAQENKIIEELSL